MGTKAPEIRGVLNEFEDSRRKSRLDFAERFPRGVSKQIFQACRRHLKGWHVIVSAGACLLATKNMAYHDSYTQVTSETRITRGKRKHGKLR